MFLWGDYRGDRDKGFKGKRERGEQGGVSLFFPGNRPVKSCL
nr:MAG TPA: hypothetical protein [Caudoviricetes sp.]